jgi:ureidoglycolate lyase
MSEPFEVSIQRLTPQTFSRYGQIIGLADTQPDYVAGGLRGWRSKYFADGETILLYIHYDYVPLECDSLERHFKVTQSFVPLSDAPSIMVVAAPTSVSTFPRPQDVAAFYVPGSYGIMLWKGTWHALTRFPLSLSGATFAFLSERRTQQELEDTQRSGAPTKLTENIDLRKLYGSVLKIDDPAQLLKIQPRADGQVDD